LGMIISGKSQIPAMFPKIYKHLEDINESLKTGKTHSEDANELSARISVQLELMNESILAQNRLLSQQASQKEIQQAGLKKSSPLQVISLFMIGIGIVAVGILSYYTFQLSKITKNPPRSETQPIAEPAAFRLPASALSAKLDELTDRKAEVQQHLAKLDSLIDQQTQSLRELKKLNSLAVRNFTNIRDRLYRADSTDRKTQIFQADSLSTAK
jgi:hypothetical protein